MENCMNCETKLAARMVEDESYSNHALNITKLFWSGLIDQVQFLFQINTLKLMAEEDHEKFPFFQECECEHCKKESA